MIWLLACTIPVDVGGDCSFVELTEVRASRPGDVVPEYAFVGREDYIEVHNRGPDPVDLLGFQFHGNQSQQPVYTVPQSCIIPAGGYQVLLAALYEDGLEHQCVEGDTLTTGFDLNNDGDAVYIWDRSGDACTTEAFLMPDQHADYVWSRNPDDPETWCASEMSPGDPNPDCFCELSDAC